jgi:hypothetical protein
MATDSLLGGFGEQVLDLAQPPKITTITKREGNKMYFFNAVSLNESTDY